MRNAVITAAARNWVFVLAMAGAGVAGARTGRAGISTVLPKVAPVSGAAASHVSQDDSAAGRSAAVRAAGAPAWLLRPELVLDNTRRAAGALPRPVLSHTSDRGQAGAIPAPTAALNGLIGIAGLTLAAGYRRLRRAF